MLPTGLDLDKIIEGGFWSIFAALLIIIVWGAIKAIQDGKIKLVPFKVGDRGFLEIFGMPLPWLVKGGTWPYLEGVITQSKTSVRKRTITIVRRDRVGNDIVITIVKIVCRVIDTKQKIWRAIYDFVDPEVTGGLSDGVNVEFQEYLGSVLCNTAGKLVESGVISSVSDEQLLEGFIGLCGERLEGVGVEQLETILTEHAPPNEFAAGSALRESLGRFVVLSHDAS